jgi:O-antigen ligase
LSADTITQLLLLLGAATAAWSLLAAPGRRRSALLLGALALCPPLVIGDQWGSPGITALRDDPLLAAVLVALGLVGCAALAFLFRWRPELLPLAVVAALPFRVPLEAGGEEANLLVPLYLVIAGGAAAAALQPPSARPGGDAYRGLWLRRALAAFVLLYAVQAIYSEDLANAVKTSCFFLIPFSALFVLMSEVRWDRALQRRALLVVVVSALALALIGFAQYVSRELFWNPEVITSNEFHVYFRVNSLFWDPNVFGRYLALVLVVLVAVLLWTRSSRTLAIASTAAGVLFLALLITFSQSSYVALLAGLAVLGALRWSLAWTALITAIAGVAALVALAGSGVSLDELNKDTGGREGLVSGGLELFADRPLWGYGSGSFSEAFIRHVVGAVPPVSESHNEPVTVAAEQGLLGLAALAALLATALATLASGFRGVMPGLGGSGPGDVGRAAILAAFVALLAHTLAYAGLFEDPITWLLLGMAVALAAGPRSRPPAASPTSPRLRPAPEPAP